jgi:hypothetical protein
VFDIQDIVNSFEIIVGQCAFPYGNDFIVGVGSGCGDYFLCIPDPYNLAPAIIDAIVF